VIILHTLGTSIDELTSEETLNSDEILSTVLVLVGVSEDNLGERSATTSVVHNFLDYSLDVTIRRVSEKSFLPFSFGEVKGSELSRSDSL
jgi:hypothetical protein